MGKPLESRRFSPSSLTRKKTLFCMTRTGLMVDY
ncbi:hypothetical protein X474_17270 [Dethiosulfatarculus sandiegensis]|uniref:Uncharacterized protein n=1 Tax=Dethiosulfatarculus sandiegensis TaxID=1429043 RepID=A0A0D2GD03_9BACT|nr:hypothetical protein X474_17270 [Dethiosulfatarculus sandiegensis]